MSKDTEPLDQRIIVTLIKWAEQFEKAVWTGENFVAAVAAARLAGDLRRFLPRAFSGLSLPKTESRQFNVGVPQGTLSGRNPDPAYSKIVRDSTRRFKEAISNGDSAGAVEALLPTGIITAPNPEEELHKLESEADRASGTTRLLFIPRMAKLALWIGDIGKAERYASETLHLTAQSSGIPVDSDEAIHDGNMVLGLVALRRRDKERAKQHLLASVRTAGSLEMKMGGPNLTLADELLKIGEREAVIEYLEGCRIFWRRERGELGKWIEKIRKGEDPEFDISHFSS
jgi:hypothetical protein